MLSLSHIQSMEEPHEPATKKIKTNTYKDNRKTWDEIDRYIQENNPSQIIYILRNLKDIEEKDVEKALDETINKALDLGFTITKKYNVFKHAVQKASKQQENPLWEQCINTFLEKKVTTQLFDSESILGTAWRCRYLPLAYKLIQQKKFLAAQEIITEIDSMCKELSYNELDNLALRLRDVGSVQQDAFDYNIYNMGKISSYMQRTYLDNPLYSSHPDTPIKNVLNENH